MPHRINLPSSLACLCSWLERNLSPAVQYYRAVSGAPGHQETHLYFYRCPMDRISSANLRASFDALICSAEARTVEVRLAAVPVREYLDHMPTRATQRVMRSLLAGLAVSSSFAENRLGVSAISLHRAKTRMDLALLMSCELERTSFTVRSDVTVDRQHHRRLIALRERRAEQLADEHGGGVDSKAERLRELGLDLKELVEEAALQLGEYEYDDAVAAIDSGSLSTEGGSAAISKRRDSSLELRGQNATWANIARAVTKRASAMDASLTVTEKDVRLICVAHNPNTREGRRHAKGDAAAQVPPPSQPRLFHAYAKSGSCVNACS